MGESLDAGVEVVGRDRPLGKSKSSKTAPEEERVGRREKKRKKLTICKGALTWKQSSKIDQKV